MDAHVMFDRETNRNKGFGFVTFEDDDGVDRAMEATGQELEGKPVSRGGGGGIRRAILSFPGSDDELTTLDRSQEGST